MVLEFELYSDLEMQCDIGHIDEGFERPASMCIGTEVGLYLLKRCITLIVCTRYLFFDLCALRQLTSPAEPARFTVRVSCMHVYRTCRRSIELYEQCRFQIYQFSSTQW